MQGTGTIVDTEAREQKDDVSVVGTKGEGQAGEKMNKEPWYGSTSLDSIL